ncbi:polyadenylate-binding protein-interacting protein 9 [Brassica rapa]|uniref:RRM domain-containing protein n=1 Tax=Brassica campestris TaxID=3711 RepID=M4DYG3_BRACM|nr:polyadenylate-binding protein-interacting protein 9 [Brassica rapa]
MAAITENDPMAVITENVHTEKYIDVAKDVHEICVKSDGEKTIGDGIEKIAITSSKKESQLKPESELDMKNVVAMFKKLNPLAKEFFPSYHNNTKKNNNTGKDNQIMPADDLVAKKNQSGEEFDHDLKKDDNNRKRRNGYSQGRRRLNGRISKAEREDSIRRTVYVSDIDQSVTEEGLAGLFSNCGQVVDCRICGDPHSVLRFAFVEFADDQGAREALRLGGTMLGYYPVRVLPSKTAILPVNPTFLPRSEDEREMCSRTIYCTNIDKKVSQADVRNFFESACGEVTRLRLLGDQLHSTRIAFVEFALADIALRALSCSGMVVGSQPIRVSPSKTPVRPRITQPSSTN